jgi:hypothetical protein
MFDSTWFFLNCFMSCTLQGTCTSRDTEGAADFAVRCTPRRRRHTKSKGLYNLPVTRQL